jgi:hypothetical protein
LIVISEKATVSGILRPVLQQYGIPFFQVHGFNSATKMHELAEEIAADERRTVLLYCGDFDPSGMFMSVVDVPKRLGRYGAGDSYILERIALTQADVRSGSLPKFKAETRKKDRLRLVFEKLRSGLLRARRHGPERIARPRDRKNTGIR